MTALPFSQVRAQFVHTLRYVQRQNQPVIILSTANLPPY